MQSKIEPEYGIVGAGAVSASLVGQLPRNARALGPVAGVSYRVASRIANTLQAGWPVRSIDELDRVRLILFYSPREHFPVLSDALMGASIQWAGKSLIFCDCDAGAALVDRFRNAGASVARLRRCGLAGRLAVEGSAPALTLANRLIRELKVKPLAIDPGTESLFDGAMTLGSAALTPLLDGVARMLRQCGVRDTDAVQLAAGLFARTAADYAHSGRQSWAWHIERPDAGELLAQMDAMGEPFKSLLRELALLGFGAFDRHPSVARLIEKAAHPE
jgi:hypothetical protein